jgi:hypothetical protein
MCRLQREGGMSDQRKLRDMFDEIAFAAEGKEATLRTYRK